MDDNPWKYVLGQSQFMFRIIQMDTGNTQTLIKHASLHLYEIPDPVLFENKTSSTNFTEIQTQTAAVY